MKHRNLILILAVIGSFVSCTNDGIDNSYMQDNVDTEDSSDNLVGVDNNKDSVLEVEVAPMDDATKAFKELRDNLTNIIAKINNKTDYSRYEGTYIALLDDYQKKYPKDNAKAINGYKNFLDAYKAFLFCTKDDGWKQVLNIVRSYKRYLSKDQRTWFANTYACNENIFKILYDKVPGIDLKKAWYVRTNDKYEKEIGINWPEIK